MPANLTPMYLKAERDYRRAQSAAEQVECLQQMLQLVPKHKGTDKLQADIKSRLSESRQALKEQLNAPKSNQTFRIPRQGAGRVVIIGGPNCGKCRILKELTRAAPEVAPFPFTTREPLPAMMDYEGVQIQLVDTPPIIAGQLPPWMLNLVRTADAVVLVFNGSSDDAPEDTAAVVREFSCRKTQLSSWSGFAEDDLSIIHVPCELVVTHANDVDCDARIELLAELAPLTCLTHKAELEEEGSRETLRGRIFQQLNIIRIFTKPPGQSADMTSPLTISKGGTVEDLALQVHESIAESLQYARIWGGSNHAGEIVGRDYVLSDKDVIELH